jgi:hypothetical protein
MQLMVFFCRVQGHSGIMASRFSFTHIEYKNSSLSRHKLSNFWPKYRAHFLYNFIFDDEIMSESPINRIESARFFQQMLAELRAVAKTNRIEMLANLIEIAYIEGSHQLRKDLGAGSRVNQRNVSA